MRKIIRYILSLMPHRETKVSYFEYMHEINPSCKDGWYIKQICPMRKTDYNGYSKTYFYVLFERAVYGKWENKKTDSENK